MNKTLIVAKREYLRVVRKKSFWISTLCFPILIIFIMAISMFSSLEAAQKVQEAQNNAKGILIIDNSNLIKPEIIEAPYSLAVNVVDSKAKVKSGEVDALIIFAEDFLTSKNVEIYQQDQGLFFSGRFNDVVKDFVKQSVLAEIKDENKITLLNTEFNIDTTSFKDGELAPKLNIADFVIPLVSMILYVILSAFATSYLLMSVSEEKENRMIEIILSTLTPKQLITGKLIGLGGVIITQILALTIFTFIGAIIVGGIFAVVSIPSFSQSIQSASQSDPDIASLSQMFNNSNLTIQFNPIQIILGIFYTLVGFFILACTMVGVGAAVPTYKDAQNFSAVFIMISIFPMYFITSILADPSGTVAKVFSFFPFSASVVLLMRNAMNELSVLEILLSIIVLIVYAMIAYRLAFKMFEIGAFEYSRRVSLKNLFS